MGIERVRSDLANEVHSLSTSVATAVSTIQENAQNNEKLISERARIVDANIRALITRVQSLESAAAESNFFIQGESRSRFRGLIRFLYGYRMLALSGILFLLSLVGIFMVNSFKYMRMI